MQETVEIANPQVYLKKREAKKRKRSRDPLCGHLMTFFFQLSVAGRPITNAFELIAVSGALDISTLLQVCFVLFLSFNSCLNFLRAFLSQGKKLAHRSKHTRFCSKKKGSEVFQRLRDAIATFSYEQKV